MKEKKNVIVEVNNVRDLFKIDIDKIKHSKTTEELLEIN